jgi:hypothetical protein
MNRHRRSCSPDHCLNRHSACSSAPVVASHHAPATSAGSHQTFIQTPLRKNPGLKNRRPRNDRKLGWKPKKPGRKPPDPGWNRPNPGLKPTKPPWMPPKAVDGLAEHSAITVAMSAATIAFEMDLRIFRFRNLRDWRAIVLLIRHLCEGAAIGNRRGFLRSRSHDEASGESDAERCVSLAPRRTRSNFHVRT